MSIEGNAERAGVARTAICRRWRPKDQVLLEASQRLTVNVGKPVVGSVSENLAAFARQIDLMPSRTAFGHLLPRALSEVASGLALGRGYARKLIEARRKAIAEASQSAIKATRFAKTAISTS